MEASAADPARTASPSAAGPTTPRSASPSARAADAQERLYRAAVQEFSVKGFHGTSTRDIAAAAGMSPAAIYVHHPSKEDILYRISRRGHESVLGVVRAAAESSIDPVERLRAVVREFVVFHASGHTSARIVNYELHALAPEHRAEIEALRHAVDGEMQQVVRAGAEAGVFSCPEPRVAALALVSLGVDVARWYRDEGGWTPAQLGEHYADLALRVVGARTG